MSAELDRALTTARILVDQGYSIDQVVENPLIPLRVREHVREALRNEAVLTVTPARTIVRDANRPDWLAGLDRSAWYYWPTLRAFHISVGKFDPERLRSLEDSSDKVLRQLESPSTPRYDTRGLVLGFVQSGKTANFTALIAKAADAGYRLFIVLSGTDNGLRAQTNTRLKKELVGYPDGRPKVVQMPPIGRQWHEFTTPDFNGDFQPGNANQAALQGNQPVLIVAKKNGAVLTRLKDWLADSGPGVLQNLPVLVVDDEADLASIDTRGSHQTADSGTPVDGEPYESPSKINGHIRDLLRKFHRVAYVAYTATPFANVLIPHDNEDPEVGRDLFPRDFIIDLPRPKGYFGAEEIFGIRDDGAGSRRGGLDVFHVDVKAEDLEAIERDAIPESLELALLDFILAGAGRGQRGDSEQPATMLVHVNQYTTPQGALRRLVEVRFAELRDEWRYQRKHGLEDRLRKRWDSEFCDRTRKSHPDRVVSYAKIEPCIGPFVEAVQVREINSVTGDVLDYDRDPSLKAIAVGGNRLSRGLTLEGLIVSYFARESNFYDTLMQMGRWFGFRTGYEDLTRIWTTPSLASAFADLAFAEKRLREDVLMYEEQGLTPEELGTRIWQHPSMQVTSPLKKRFSRRLTLQQSYSLTLQQTFKFPFSRPDDLIRQARENLQAVRSLVQGLGKGQPPTIEPSGPVWTGVSAGAILDFLGRYVADPQGNNLSLPLIVEYIGRCVAAGELVRWAVAVRGRKNPDPALGKTGWGLSEGEVGQISRSRLQGTDSLGVITDNTARDEAAGFSAEQLLALETALATGRRGTRAPSPNVIARKLRPPEEGLLLLYPISKASVPRLDPGQGGTRVPLFEDSRTGVDLVGLALSFPGSGRPHPVEAYLTGTAGWRPRDEP